MKYSGFFYLCIFFFLAGCQTKVENIKRDESSSLPIFEQIPNSKTKIDFKLHQALPAGDKTGLLSGGAGVALGDVNNDGWIDLFFSGGYQNSRLYLNKGDFTFSDVTEDAGIQDALEGQAHTEGINLVDINGDGWLDIFICKSGLLLNDSNKFTDYGKNLLFINQQDGTFKESAIQFGLDLVGLTSSAQFFDFDRDGDLDVYLAQLPEVGAAFNFAYYQKPPAHPVLSDRLLENRSGKYIDVSDAAGILYERNLSLSTTVLDINQDSWPDLYVANDFFGRDFLYINQQDGTFKEDLKSYFSKTPMSSMGSDVGDINNDGYPDLFVGEMMPHSNLRQKTNLVPFSLEIYDRLLRIGYPQYTRNMLFQNINGEAMQEIGLMADIYATEWSWGALFFDADMDGKEDLFIANGIRRDMTNMDFVKKNVGEKYTEMANPEVRSSVNPDQAPTFVSPNFMYRNIDGYRFQEVTTEWNLHNPIHTRGAAYGDLDNDGDLDLVWNNIESPPSIFKNNSDQQTNFHYLKIRLVGAAQNKQAFGASLKLEQQGKVQTKFISSQRGYQSMPEVSISFAVVNGPIDRLHIYWPDGSTQSLENIDPDQYLEINQTDGLKPRTDKFTGRFEELFTLNFQHTEKAFSDFKEERLLLQQYSKQGPALAINDVNNDGLEDIFIGGSSGQSGKLFVQHIDKSFSLSQSQPWQDDLFSEDVDALFFDANRDGHADLAVASGGNEIKEGAIHYQDRLYLNDGKGTFAKSNLLPENRMSTTSLAISDIDKDGDLDLFSASCITPGSFAKNPQSYLHINDQSGFKKAPDQVLGHLGLRISSSTFTDMNNDGWDDLVITGEWTGPSIYFNQMGKFEINSPILPDLGGWWLVIKTADIDADGDQDIIAGNHGLNSIFQATEQQPMSLLINDFDQNGQLEPVLFKYTYGVNGPFANRDLFCSQMPSFNNQYFSFESYGKATYANMFNQQLKQSSEINRAYEMRSCWFENLEKGVWKKHAFPSAVQSMPVNDLIVEDFDQDGHLDILIGGGSNSNHYEYGSIDGKLILLLQRPGKNFEILDSHVWNIKSPIKRISSLEDGRFVVASNGGSVKILALNIENKTFAQ